MKTKEQAILDVAENLIRRRGYQGFSYKDIAAPLGIKNAAVHYYFPTKGDLGTALLLRNLERLRTAWAGVETASPKARLALFWRFYREDQARGWLCILGALGVNYSSLPTQMQTALQALTAALTDWLTETLEAGRALEHWQFEGAAKTQSAAMVATLLGTLILERVQGMPLLDTIIKQFETSLIR